MLTSIGVRFADTTLIDLAAGGTAVDLEFAYTLSALPDEPMRRILLAHATALSEACESGLDQERDRNEVRRQLAVIRPPTQHSPA